jgi:class 3 adenylate cyclase
MAEHSQNITRELGLQARTGVHVGEVEARGSDIGGIAVHLAARVMGHAGSDQVVVSSTAVDSALGSGFSFSPLGSHPLKGIDGEWNLFALPPRH